MGKNFWMVVESPEKFEIMRDGGLTLYGLGRKYRKRAERMQPEDRVLFYISKIRKWTATATISSDSFVDKTPIFGPEYNGELFPHRVRLKPNIILPSNNYIEAGLIAPRLEYLKRWIPEEWPLAFFETLHLIPQRDFKLIESEMRRMTPKHDRGNVNRHRGRRKFRGQKFHHNKINRNSPKAPNV